MEVQVLSRAHKINESDAKAFGDFILQWEGLESRTETKSKEAGSRVGEAEPVTKSSPAHKDKGPEWGFFRKLSKISLILSHFLLDKRYLYDIIKEGKIKLVTQRH